MKRFRTHLLAHSNNPNVSTITITDADDRIIGGNLVFDRLAEAEITKAVIEDVVEEWPTCPNGCHTARLTVSALGPIPKWSVWGCENTVFYPHIYCGEHILSPWGLHNSTHKFRLVSYPKPGLREILPGRVCPSTKFRLQIRQHNVIRLRWTIHRAPTASRHWVINSHTPGDTVGRCLECLPAEMSKGEVLGKIDPLLPRWVPCCGNGCHILLPQGLHSELYVWQNTNKLSSQWYCEDSGQLLSENAIIPVDFNPANRLPDISGEFLRRVGEISW